MSVRKFVKAKLLSVEILGNEDTIRYDSEKWQALLDRCNLAVQKICDEEIAYIHRHED